eukprot:8659465-Alexandrium_andersonii.AAC.1
MCIRDSRSEEARVVVGQHGEDLVGRQDGHLNAAIARCVLAWDRDLVALGHQHVSHEVLGE